MPGLSLLAFDRLNAGAVASWIQTENELRLLAPSTPPPLTAEKVSGWLRPSGLAFSLISDGDPSTVGYAELSPMRSDATHLWIGHVVLRPNLRGHGLGQEFVRLMVTHAFDVLKANRISLIVFPENKAAIRCYRSVGFEEVGEEHHQFGGQGPKERMLRLEIYTQVPRDETAPRRWGTAEA